MKVLLLGGTGVLSNPVYGQCVQKGFDTYVLNRGNKKIAELASDHAIIADVRRAESVKAAIGDAQFDVVVDFLSYTPEDLHRTITLLEKHMKHYVFISSATAYSINDDRPISEDQPLVNNGWSYAVDKAICEARLARMAVQKGFQYTIIRPYVTYGDTRIPFALCKRYQQWSVVNRILTDKPVLLWDNGEAGCPLTHASDFARGLVGLIANEQAYGQAYHITSDDVRSWNEVVTILGNILNKKPQVIYVPSQTLEKEFPEYGHELTGDKARSYRFNNDRIKAHVEGFQCRISLEEGLTKTIAYYQSEPSMQKVDAGWDAAMDRVIAKYTRDHAIRAKLHFIAPPRIALSEKARYMIHRYPFPHQMAKGAALFRRFLKRGAKILRAKGKRQ